MAALLSAMTQLQSKAAPRSLISHPGGDVYTAWQGHSEEK